MHELLRVKEKISSCTINLPLLYITLNFSSKELQVPFLIYLFIYGNVGALLRGYCCLWFLSQKHKMLIPMNQISNNFHQRALTIIVKVLKPGPFSSFNPCPSFPFIARGNCRRETVSMA